MAGLLWPTAAAGQERCGKRAAMVAQLEARYGERRVSFMLTGSGFLLEMFATDDGTTWSLLITDPYGKTCLKGAGTGFRLDRSKPDGTAL